MAWRGQISKNLKELRILLCQSSASSSATRAFIEKNYKDLKTLNPKLPILIREAKGIEPQLWARYDMGVERGVRLEGLSESQISKSLEELVKGHVEEEVFIEFIKEAGCETLLHPIVAVF